PQLADGCVDESGDARCCVVTSGFSRPLRAVIGSGRRVSEKTTLVYPGSPLLLAAHPGPLFADLLAAPLLLQRFPIAPFSPPRVYDALVRSVVASRSDFRFAA